MNECEVKDIGSCELYQLAITWCVQPKCPVDEEAECSICMEVFEAPLRTPCHHWFCGECIQQVLQQRNSCPLCRHSPITRAHLRAAVYPQPEPKPELKAERDPDEAGPSTSSGKVSCIGQLHVDSKINVCFLLKPLTAST
jgi:hypothetical protein